MPTTRRHSVQTIRGNDRGYVAFHAPRYQLLLDLLATHGLTSRSSLLDIGPSRLTTLIREEFGAAVDSLGFAEDRVEDNHKHWRFDLNHAQDPAQWRRDLPTYDFVVLAEVLEHLHTAPELVLAFVKSLMVDGGVLIVQTPNAVSLPKRLKLLLGLNPYEMIRLAPGDPGHFREYTLSELRRLIEASGLRIESLATGYYFDARYAHHEAGQANPRMLVGAIKNVTYRLLPKTFREGITAVCRKP